MKTLEIPSMELSQKEINTITEEVIHASDLLVKSVKNLDAAGCLNFWLDAKEMRYVENTRLFASYKAFADYCKETFSKAQSADYKLEKREVHPLTHEIACFTANFDFNMKFKDGSTWKDTGILTATMVKKDNKWRVINGHESTSQRNIQ